MNTFKKVHIVLRHVNLACNMTGSTIGDIKSVQRHAMLVAGEVRNEKFVKNSGR